MSVLISILRLSSAVLCLGIAGSSQVCRFVHTGVLDDRSFLVMELLGPSLSEVRKRQGGGPLSVALIVDLGKQVGNFNPSKFVSS